MRTWGLCAERGWQLSQEAIGGGASKLREGDLEEAGGEAVQGRNSQL